jgi:hypothetical protein
MKPKKSAIRRAVPLLVGAEDQSAAIQYCFYCNPGAGMVEKPGTSADSGAAWPFSIPYTTHCIEQPATSVRIWERG